MDAIHETEELEKLLFEFTAFFNNASYVVDNISHPQLARPQYNAFQDFVFIFAMRETTRSKISEHFNDRLIGSFFDCDVSTIFKKNEFINRKYDYIINDPNIKNDLLKSKVKQIKDVLDDYFFRENIFPLFNYDYRSIVNALTIAFKNYDLDICHQLLKSDF